MRENRCQMCKFWAVEPDRRAFMSGNEDCRRHAPTPYYENRGDNCWGICNWPKTNHDDWCGDFVDFRVLGIEPDPLTK
jgi:hypothetical protein